MGLCMREMIIKEADIQPNAVSVGEITYPPGGTLGPRLQSYLQLVIVHSGHMTIRVGTSQFLVGANHVLLLLPGYIEHFSFSLSQETTHSWVHASIGPLSELQRKYLIDLPRPIIFSSIMRNLMSEALKLRHSLLPIKSPTMKAIVIYMFWKYIGEAEQQMTQREQKSTSQNVEKARDFMHRNLGQHLSVETVAQAVHLSKSQLTRVFKTELNITPMAYLWQQRVLLGIDLLRNTGLPVGVIADQCGFKNHYHFSRSVRKETQMSPSQLRKSWWRGNQ